MSDSIIERVLRRVRRRQNREPLKVVAIDGRIACPDPILLLAPHRTGSSLLRLMVDSHPHVACPAETYLLGAGATMLRDPDVVVGLRALGVPDDDHDQSLWAWLTSFHESYRRALDKPRWADKTPQNLLHLDSILRLAPAGTVLIGLARDPLECYASVQAKGWSLGTVGRSDDNDEANAVVLRREFEQLFELATERGDALLRMTYDSLTRDSEEAMRAVCRHVGEPYSASMVRPWERRHTDGVQDPRAAGSNEICPGPSRIGALSRRQRAIADDVLGDVRERYFSQWCDGGRSLGR